MSRSKRSNRAVTFLVATAVVATTAGVASASTAPASEPGKTARASAPSGPLSSSLKGWGRMDYPDAGHDIQVTVDAHATFKGVGWAEPVVPAADSKVITGGYDLTDRVPAGFSRSS
ncbi:hypothetical protein [Streptomyces sp. CB02115]|uniref:hypothetical protein n=1 Tax=Streptomyces sp. CB02115 TaxID=1703939 RepID=UPI00093C63E0|nr:hypothetical protein [Streptomyces sp. CB02115]OKJ54374.1 hypothetical protein AMK28_19945 [Streptomyces sp. CB02115]